LEVLIAAGDIGFERKARVPRVFRQARSAAEEGPHVNGLGDG